MASDKSVDIDDVLVNFNVFGRYHIVALMLVFIANMSNCLYSFNYVFAAEKVEYRCLNESISLNSTCGSGLEQCTHWVYDNPDSFVAEFQLACQEWKRTLVGTVHSLGNMIGLIIVGPISDRIGRKSTVIFTGVAGGIFGVARSFTTWYWLYIALEFSEAVIGDISSPIYMLAAEIVATKKRVLFITLTGLGYPCGGIILAVVAWLFPYWRTVLQVIYSPALLFLLYKCFLDESPRWLLSKGRKIDASAILDKASKTNNIRVDKDLLEKLTHEENKDIGLGELLRKTFLSKALMNRFIICVVWWATSTFVNYGMVINSVSLQGDKYINFALTSAVELPGMFIIMLILKYFKRKFSLILCFFLGALMCLIQPFVPQNLPWLSVLLYMIGILISTFYFNITYLYTSELFPTYTRNSMHAFCSSLGRIGSIVAPQTPLLMVYWPGLPSIVFGSAALVAGLLTFLVPDTADVSLPDNVKQAEEIGRLKSKQCETEDGNSPCHEEMSDQIEQYKLQTHSRL